MTLLEMPAPPSSLGTPSTYSRFPQSAIDPDFHDAVSIPRSKTVSMPYFSKFLLLLDLPIAVDIKGKGRADNCAFLLASHLGLLPGQPNDNLAEYDLPRRHDRRLIRNSCCCARISRHGLVFLISRYFQRAAIRPQPGTDTPCLMITTTFGQFTFHQSLRYVHFDSGGGSSDHSLVEDITLEGILNVARGKYLVNDTPRDKTFAWHRIPIEHLEVSATGNFFGIPKAVVYLPKNVFKRWKRLESFSKDVVEAVRRVVGDIKEPPSILKALYQLPTGRGGKSQFRISMNNPAEKLVACYHSCSILSSKNVVEMDFDKFHMFVWIMMVDLLEAHQHFRGLVADPVTLFTTSQDRFIRLLEYYSLDDVEDKHLGLQSRLKGLLIANHNNLALVVFQALLAIVAQWNSSRVLLNARAVPEEWIEFIAGEDNDVYLG